MHHSTHGNNDGHHWYADFTILCFLMTHFKDLWQAHTIVYLKKYNSKILTFTPNLLNQNIESLSTICRLQENKMFEKRPPLVASQYNSLKSIKENGLWSIPIWHLTLTESLSAIRDKVNRYPSKGDNWTVDYVFFF